MEIRLHDLGQYEIARDEVPRYAAYSLESGETDEVAALDGVGFICRYNDDSLIFTTGENSYEQDLTIPQQVISAAREALVLTVEDTEVVLPLDAEAIAVLRGLYELERDD